MTSPNFAAGVASDGLIRITSPGSRAIFLSGRELRREAERKERRQVLKAQSPFKGFGTTLGITTSRGLAS